MIRWLSLVLLLLLPLAGCTYAGATLAAILVGGDDGGSATPLVSSTPDLAVSTPASRPTVGPAALQVTLASPLAEATSLALSYSGSVRASGAAVSGMATVAEPISALATSASGVSVPLSWDFPGDLGGTAAHSVSWTVTAIDASGDRKTITTPPFLVGNDTPIIGDQGGGVFVGVSGSGGDLLLEVDLSDSTGDSCDLAITFDANELAGPSRPPASPAAASRACRPAAMACRRASASSGRPWPSPPSVSST